MDLLFLDAWWMTFNLSLALIAITIGWLVFSTTNNFIRMTLALIWLLFLPNTLYLVTDLKHLFAHLLQVDGYLQPLLAAQFLLITILGLISYVLAVYPIDLLISQSLSSRHLYVRYGFITVVSMLSSLGIMIGRFYRIHSWEAITQPSLISTVLVEIVVSPDILLLVALFGVWSLLFYLNAYPFITIIAHTVYLGVSTKTHASRHRQ